MGRINLQSLIDEVLGMAKQDQDYKKKKMSEYETTQINQSWDDTPAGQAYWKDIRGRNTATEKQATINQPAQETPGRVARQSLGTKFQGDNGKGLSDFLTKIAEQDSDLFTNQARKPELESLKKNLSEMGLNQPQPGVTDADAPTPEEIQNLHLQGMDDKEFRKSVDNNLGLKGAGYVLNDKTGKMTRVIGNDVYSGGSVNPVKGTQAQNIVDAFKQPMAENNQTKKPAPMEISKDVVKAQQGYNQKYSIWDRMMAGISAAGDAEAGIYSPNPIPPSPMDIINKNRKENIFKRKKQQEEENASAYSIWANRNR